MYDAGKVVGGLVVFLILVTSPLWFNAISATSEEVPELQPPPNGAEQCVEAKDSMRESHMDLLNEWRDVVVREGRRDYVSSHSGVTYDMSLTRTCLSCHSNKAEFCDACHTYMAVDPYCWDCHVVPKEGQ